ncbi:MAG: polysaccharide deacetylase family protein [Proteobacteria bacterium]|nr:polysaccharide deacetylase family protein [Pseudomonadota bacterium]
MIRFVTALIIITTNLIFAGEIALTFDDLPCNQDESAAKQMEINQKILQALAKFKAPAIGFVNEGKLYKDDEEIAKSAILKLWVDHKQPLGNHTYSHQFLSGTDAKDFQNDVIKGAAVSKKLMSDAGLKHQYFRHPYLDTGTTPEIRKDFETFLKQEGYIVAPVTVDTDDWKFNQQLLENPHNKDKIIAKYLEHTRAKFDFYKGASFKIFGRNIKHIWLLHTNLINAYAMDDLLKLAKELGYEFITLDYALEDKAYAEPDNYYAPFGVSWLYRWDFTRGKVVDWSKDPEPDNNPFIGTKSLTFTDKSRNCSIPVELYVSGESKGKAETGIVKLPVGDY